ncbi:endonuclease/exonuclease/phosphatase family protein [Neorhizobium sp. NCHU2750]|uniref:endonuclease/exonuclease/phosphatase family protein n=1 Tax=Neorhizobium sp. NCHU2750 TaxID=1825976 RepID=UPI000E72A71C|nr:endonuclease [Neorhizobium sp. NCHU2750]
MKFVSYNVQYGIGMDGRFDPERIADIIREADVIALQEITRGSPDNGGIDLAGRFAELLPDHFSVFAAPCDVFLGGDITDGRRMERRFQFGNMILSRWPILSTRHFLLPRSRSFDKLNLQRGAVEALIDAPSGPIRAYSVHLDHVSPDERIAQILYLKERVLNFAAEGGALTAPAASGFPQLPLPEDFVVMGDFNMVPGSDEYTAAVGRPDRYYGRSLRANQFVDALDHVGALSADSYSWAEPPGEGTVRMHLDYGFINAGLVPRLRSASVDNAVLGSDHFPVWLEIE